MLVVGVCKLTHAASAERSIQLSCREGTGGVAMVGIQRLSTLLIVATSTVINSCKLMALPATLYTKEVLVNHLAGEQAGRRDQRPLGKHRDSKPRLLLY